MVFINVRVFYPNWLLLYSTIVALCLSSTIYETHIYTYICMHTATTFYVHAIHWERDFAL